MGDDFHSDAAGRATPRARKADRKKADARELLEHFTVELPVYAGLVVAYFFLVLHFLGDWLYELFKENRKLYALAALALIIGQGVVLEFLTSALLQLIRTRRRS
jgi:hypothetical protein